MICLPDGASTTLNAPCLCFKLCLSHVACLCDVCIGRVDREGGISPYLSHRFVWEVSNHGLGRQCPILFETFGLLRRRLMQLDYAR